MIIEIEDRHIYEILVSKITDLEETNKELTKRVNKIQKRLETILNPKKIVCKGHIEGLEKIQLMPQYILENEYTKLTNKNK